MTFTVPNTNGVPPFSFSMKNGIFTSPLVPRAPWWRWAMVGVPIPVHANAKDTSSPWMRMRATALPSLSPTANLPLTGTSLSPVRIVVKYRAPGAFSE